MDRFRLKCINYIVSRIELCFVFLTARKFLLKQENIFILKHGKIKRDY